MNDNPVVKQLHFSDLAPLLPAEESGKTIQERFDAFHKANPHVYTNLKKISFYYKGLGFKSYSMRAVYGRLRYAVIETTGHPYKLNNDFTPLYARMLMKEEKELQGFFRTRELAVEHTAKKGWGMHRR